MKGILWGVLMQPVSIRHRFSEGHPHHIILPYNVSRETHLLLEGMKFSAIAWAECWNSQIQAVRVTLPDTVPCNKLHPHITISYQRGISPSFSNQMLASEHHTNIWEIPLKITCQIEFQPLQPHLFDFIPDDIEPKQLKQVSREDVQSWLKAGYISGISTAENAAYLSQELNLEISVQAPKHPINLTRDFICGIWKPGSTPKNQIHWVLYEAPQ
ncbi:hypothetical protein ACQ4M3_20705 [Leptolyngbya sp. AN03gr2]|uniref:hypothetical protein n=1 Tax=unclassified Leptolyngbya TaxID=2650499 RepID=UPI003D31BE95